jgi:hypothetical protein
MDEAKDALRREALSDPRVESESSVECCTQVNCRVRGKRGQYINVDLVVVVWLRGTLTA